MPHWRSKNTRHFSKSKPPIRNDKVVISPVDENEYLRPAEHEQKKRLKNWGHVRLSSYSDYDVWLCDQIIDLDEMSKSTSTLSLIMLKDSVNVSSPFAVVRGSTFYYQFTTLHFS